jgi:hypothetical protein
MASGIVEGAYPHLVQVDCPECGNPFWCDERFKDCPYMCPTCEEGKVEQKIANLELEIGLLSDEIDRCNALIAEAREAMRGASWVYHKTVVFGGQRPGAETFMKNLYDTFLPIDEWLEKTKGIEDA